MNGVIPYWACFSITNVLVRTSLIPLVLHSAHTAARFAKVAPEVQFLVTIFQQDLQKQKKEGASFGEQWMLTRQAMQTLGGIYKIHDIHPLALFKSPLAQIPVFWYFSIDLRKIINGADPALAQELTESGFLWVPDLTEPDPWFGLPILAGMLLYANVEVAIGKQSLSGEAASKSKLAYYLKDFFQSMLLSVMMNVVVVECECLSPMRIVPSSLTHFLHNTHTHSHCRIHALFHVAVACRNANLPLYFVSLYIGTGCRFAQQYLSTSIGIAQTGWSTTRRRHYQGIYQIKAIGEKGTRRKGQWTTIRKRCIGSGIGMFVCRNQSTL